MGIVYSLLQNASSLLQCSYNPYICVFFLDTAAILKTYKEKLLGLFFSLLVNHNPLHRSSGVAGLVAMVSSALLDEQEVLFLASHFCILKTMIWAQLGLWKTPGCEGRSINQELCSHYYKLF
jgi:hypothetical protein